MTFFEAVIFNVILECGASHNWSQSFDGPWSHFGGLERTSFAATFFPGGLVEPGLHITVPILMEVGIWDHLIPFGRHLEVFWMLSVTRKIRETQLYI